MARRTTAMSYYVTRREAARRRTLATREAEVERAIDARVQRRLATDRAYLNAENAEEQSEREEQITRQVERELGVNYEEG